MGWQWIFRRDLLVSIKIVPSSTFTSLEYFFCTWGKFGVFLGTHSGWKQSTLVWICPWKWIQNPGMSEHSHNWLLVLKWIASMMKTYLSWILFFFSISVFFFFFFFFSDTDDSQDSRGREGAIFIPLYHIQQFMGIQTFICNFACEMTATYFQLHCF